MGKVQIFAILRQPTLLLQSPGSQQAIVEADSPAQRWLAGTSASRQDIVTQSSLSTPARKTVWLLQLRRPSLRSAVTAIISRGRRTAAGLDGFCGCPRRSCTYGWRTTRKPGPLGRASSHTLLPPCLALDFDRRGSRQQYLARPRSRQPTPEAHRHDTAAHSPYVPQDIYASGINPATSGVVQTN